MATIVSEEIEAQLNFLKNSEVVWVRGTPHEANEACAIVRNAPLLFDLLATETYLQIYLGQGSRNIIATVIVEMYSLTPPTVGHPAHMVITSWNDSNTEATKDTVIAVLEKAYVRALELGV